MASKQILNLIKQNDGMFMGLTKKNIEYIRIVVPDTISDEEKLVLLQEENAQLKAIVQANKPPPQPKKEKAPEPAPVDEVPKEKEIVHHTYTNLEDMKRAFFGNEFESYLSMVCEHPFKFYKASYKYNEDNDGRPVYIATNLLKGIVRNYEKMGKYAMLVFRCWKKNDENKYQYESFWMLNSNEDIVVVAKNAQEDFTFEEINMETFDNNFRRINEGQVAEDMTMLAETYIH